METNVLKLVLKKNLFESIINEGVDTFRFETSGFYMSKFTSNKHNTVDKLKKDASLFKTFDVVEFTCVGEKMSFGGVHVTLIDGEVPEFELKFNNDIVVEDEELEQTPDVIDDNDIFNIDNEDVLTFEEEIIEPVELPEDSNTVLEVEDKPILANLIELLSEYKNVYVLDSRNLKIGQQGKVYGCDKNISFARNEHIYDYKLTEHTIVIDNNLEDKVDEIINRGYVFVCPSESSCDGNTVKLFYTTLKRLDILSLM